jgi:hypothetical protein
VVGVRRGPAAGNAETVYDASAQSILGLRAVFAVAAAFVLATLLGMTQVTDTAISTAEHDPAN